MVIVYLSDNKDVLFYLTAPSVGWMKGESSQKGDIHNWFDENGL